MAAVLATVTHHSHSKVGTANDVPRAQRTVTSTAAIAVPKISHDRTQQRLIDTLRQPQTAEQLVEVPTIESYSSLQGMMEQNADIPVPPGRGGWAGQGGQQGYSQGQADFAGDEHPQAFLSSGMCHAGSAAVACTWLVLLVKVFLELLTAVASARLEFLVTVFLDLLTAVPGATLPRRQPRRGSPGLMVMTSGRCWTRCTDRAGRSS